MPSNIKFPEHNSSRLIFVNPNSFNNVNDYKLYVEDITDDSNCNIECVGNSVKWLLGKLNDNIWLLEDTGVYDSNHEHVGDVYYIDNNDQKQIIYNITRVMEYGQECDRMYTEHGGGFKFLLLDGDSKDLDANFYLKYERNLAGCFEKIEDLNTNNGIIPNCIKFYKYDSNNELIVTEILRINSEIEILDNTTGNPINTIDYCNISINDISIDFSKLIANYHITENNTNDIKVGFISTECVSMKFLSANYLNMNDSVITQSYFVVQAPKNRSWICYRKVNDGGMMWDGYTNIWDDQYCGYLNFPNEGLTGHYGTYNSETNSYIYEIDIDRDNLPFIMLIPKMFCDYDSIEFFKENGQLITYFDGEPIIDIYNELDGMFYRKIVIPPASYSAKIIIEYIV